MYDAIVVGARVAGSSTARNLAKLGHRVLLLDRASVERDVLSTHFVWPRGASYLLRAGLLDRVLKDAATGETVKLAIDGIALEGRVRESALLSRMRAVHGTEGRVTTRYFSARRHRLDPMLRDAAVESGVEYREGVSIDGLLEENGRVVGVRGTTRALTPFEERAKVVVGADGRRSTIARLLRLGKSEVREGCTFAAYTYFSGVPENSVRIERRGRLGLGLSGTSGGLSMALVFGPRDWMPAFQKDQDRHFFEALELISPELRARVADGKREEPYYVTNDQAGFLRQSAGPGFVLVGDAACFKDQCTASGMTHALRDAELAAAAIDAAVREPEAFDARLAEYRERRFLDSWKYYEFVGAQAEMNPSRPEEKDLYQAIADLPEERDKLVGVFADTVPVKAFFGESNLRALRSRLNGHVPDHTRHESEVFFYYRCPFGGDSLTEDDAVALARTCMDYAQPVGPDLIGRIAGFAAWQRTRSRTETWQYSRTLDAFPGPRSRMRDEEGRAIAGLNFASQDYLALGSHPRVREAAREALSEFGPHSAGSPMIIGNTSISEALEDEIRALTGKAHVVLFPTGWAAGFGAINGLVRPEDHIVMDRLSHACLQQGARAATRRIHKHPHLDAQAARALLKEIRSRDRRNGILVLTEGIFSMDSDAPDLRALRDACGEFGATLFVDVAHDLGALGPAGTGMLGAQGLFGEVDLVMGSFSKTFASNGGFLATDDAGVKQYVKMYGNAHMFSNALSPVQAAVARETFRIVRSPEGERLRGRLVEAVEALRGELGRLGVPCLGQTSAIVPVVIGDERVARLAHREMQKRQIAAMILEYPVVAVGSSRFRLQVMASHSVEEAREAAGRIHEAILAATLAANGRGAEVGLPATAVAAPSP